MAFIAQPGAQRLVTVQRQAKMDIETRLRCLEDRNGILELTARYARYVTAADVDAIVAQFAEDGTFGRIGATLSRNQLRQMLAADLTRGDRVPLVVNHVIEMHDDEAFGTCTMYAPWSPRGPLCGDYRDHYVKVQGTWRFQGRVWCPYMPPM